ncbi:MAG TPA: bifunctional (p)ppGpp synthetase/guanosine-3',5'-bis(diphosphate) 3'-pyrophosphohydrolase [Oscillospiraceae bacterium]|nr:bifunctional (p)ppGpp synthetase/guanosine-3',5'-bis(diphosphate) 3'-pyrophosphohydrolase [Oscillospiraceae bacterium]HPS76077.1 bifunctional (p)ppGpp synthetase/guanosine-3',5'-bis(diphosphate) 3'-pyrophosphohydrolase [Oscillospiraceae bacterium]
MSEDTRTEKVDKPVNPPLDPDAMYAELEGRIAASGVKMDTDRIRAAYEMARSAHAGQLRKDGSPYVAHCVAAAEIAQEMGLDEDSIVASLLHDVIEDTALGYDDIAKKFGTAVADLVEGVTKLTRVQYTSKEDEQMENMRKMLLAMSKDIRVILIKIADRMHNMRTMAYQSEEKQRAKSLETMEIYAPLAHRLGMQRAKWELEDLALLYLDPAGYKEITTELEAKMPMLEDFMARMQKQIEDRLAADNIHASIFSRIKHIYSIYRKMYAQKLDINGIFDLCAFRVIVDSIPDCYNVLGIIHDMFKPVPGRFKDYISTPKPNMYQSVHTTVIGSEGIPFEVQIRTWEMHRTAEYGVAAHWKYKMGNPSVGDGEEESYAWVRRLLESQQDSDASDFFHNLKIDMFADEVFVFSPKGDVINLPAGATPIDFAYSIHSGVGNTMVGASVNGRIVKLDHVLQNGDIVEIRTSKNAPGPSRDWLSMAKSGSARTKIKQWFKKERRDENISTGRDMFEGELRSQGLSSAIFADEELLPQLLKRVSFSTVEDLYAAIGYGGITATKAVNRMHDELLRSQKTAEKKTVLDKVNEAAERREKASLKQGKPVHGVLVAGLDNCLIKFSRCCTPIPGDDIVGFITRGQGVSIHRADCANYLNRKNNPDDAGRWIDVGWADVTTDNYTTTILVVSKERQGLVMDIATALNAINAKVRSLNARDTDDGRALVSVTLEVKGVDELRSIMKRVAAINGVGEVTRNGD